MSHYIFKESHRGSLVLLPVSLGHMLTKAKIAQSRFISPLVNNKQSSGSPVSPVKLKENLEDVIIAAKLLNADSTHHLLLLDE